MKKKILAALSALTLGATMMGGMAMTANAANVYYSATDTTVIATYDEDGNPITGGGFYAYWRNINGDETVDENDYEVAPYGMYDGAILGNIVINSDDDAVINFKVNTFNAHGYTVKGYISSIVDSDGVSVLSGVPSGITADTENDTAAGTATLTPGETYTLTATFLTGYGTGYFNHVFPVKVVLS